MTFSTANAVVSTPTCMLPLSCLHRIRSHQDPLSWTQLSYPVPAQVKWMPHTSLMGLSLSSKPYHCIYHEAQTSYLGFWRPPARWDPPGSSWWLSPVMETFGQLWAIFRSLFASPLCFSTCFFSVTVPHPFPNLNCWCESHWVLLCIWLASSCPPDLNLKITFSDNLLHLRNLGRSSVFSMTVSASFIALLIVWCSFKNVFT